MSIVARSVVHITTADAWSTVVETDADEYVDPTLHTDGFIHCSTAEQVLIPANERFGGRSDLVLLVIDLDDVTVPVIFEDCYESGHRFPHIYGPIPAGAVKRVVPFPCRADGTFELPGGLDLA